MTRKSPEAVKLGRRGGLARARKRSKEELSAIGKLGATARWGQKQSGIGGRRKR